MDVSFFNISLKAKALTKGINTIYLKKDYNQNFSLSFARYLPSV